MNSYNKNEMDKQAEREGQALNRALQPSKGHRPYDRLRQRKNHNEAKFDTLFKDK